MDPSPCPTWESHTVGSTRCEREDTYPRQEIIIIKNTRPRMDKCVLTMCGSLILSQREYHTMWDLQTVTEGIHISDA